MKPEYVWNQDDVEYLIKHFPNSKSQVIADHLGKSVSSVRDKAYLLGLKKSDQFYKSADSGRINSSRKFDNGHRFKSGHVPFNKGKKADEYLCQTKIEKLKHTSYKKGELPHNTKADGVITIRKDSKGRLYKFIRVEQAKWIHLHVYNWMQVHGPIPKGNCIVFKNYDTMNCDIENLMMISRKENMLRNSIHNYPPEIKETIKVLSKLKKVINGKK